ncbi:MAG: protein TolQ [Holosporaceae bacterium]|jgi:biopolymer transport protein TolQ|nr:protein TolQ [Holosporaceae bacterium]
MNGVEGVVTTINAASNLAATNAMTKTAEHGFSMLGMFMQATLTVKCVIILLIACSFWSWTIIFAKLSFIKKLKAKADRFEEIFWNTGSIDALYNSISSSDDPFVVVFIAGMKEWKRSQHKITSVLSWLSAKDRLENMMRIAIGREIEHLERHLGFLATTGAIAPFVGLFGMVWGIMNSFESISLDQNASLVSVAPGIAEALFTTALGLVVTIPAVIAYNKISAEINNYQNRLDAFVEEFSAAISRQLEDSDI